MRVLAPAKINLHLRVGPVRADGFHPLLTWMCTVSLFDILNIRRAGGEGITLTIEPADASRESSSTDGSTVALSSTREPDSNESGSAGHAGAIHAGVIDTDTGSVNASHGSRGKNPVVPADGTNLVVRAASSWVTAVEGIGEGSLSRTSFGGLSISLRKVIPVGAGLGGGSSDAARTLIALNRSHGSPFALPRLTELAAKLGSDVPFFLHGPSSICKGRGENVTPMPPPTARFAVLFLPGIVMPTAHVYQRFDAMKLGESDAVDDDSANVSDWKSWATMPAKQLLTMLVNDLEAPAFSLRPDLGELRATLERTIGRIVRMSGSGSSLFSLFDDEDEAHDAIARVGNVFSGKSVTVELCPTVD